MIPLTDAEFETIKALLNDTIHELVFAVQLLEQDDLYDALTCLTTAALTIEVVSLEIAEKEAQ